MLLRHHRYPILLFVAVFLQLFVGTLNAQEYVFGSIEWLPSSLEGNVYKLPRNTNRLPDFSTLSPQSKVYTSSLNIPERAWSEGFPGVRGINEWFGIDYRGNFTVKQDGKYTFRLSSDDGSKLYIDDKLIINNDGTHPTSSKSGTIELSTSIHKINVQYFQGPRYHIALQLFVAFEDNQEVLFPGDDLEVETPPEIRFVRPTKGGYQVMLDVEYGEPFFAEVYYDQAPDVDIEKIQLIFIPASEPEEIDIFRTKENKNLYRSKKLSLTE